MWFVPTFSSNDYRNYVYGGIVFELIPTHALNWFLWEEVEKIPGENPRSVTSPLMKGTLSDKRVIATVPRNDADIRHNCKQFLDTIDEEILH